MSFRASAANQERNSENERALNFFISTKGALAVYLANAAVRLVRIQLKETKTWEIDWDLNIS